MYSSTLDAVSEAAAKKAAYFRSHPLGYLTAAALAGVYVGFGILLAFTVGAPFAAQHAPCQKLVMGASFAIALSLVVFAGAELFTGNNLAMAVGYWRRATTIKQLIMVWSASWAGNLIGGALLATLLFYSTVLNGTAEMTLVQQAATKKMLAPISELLVKGILCNWLVCLAVWCTFRMRSEAGKLIIIFWCLYAFVAAGFEHSVANMTLLSLALLQPHTAQISFTGFAHNLLWVTLGNAIGGMLFVGGAYQITDSKNTNCQHVSGDDIPRVLQQ
ncbi:MAG TPA: formate/nitrite transporter family protein [Armatimonadota bacterium]|nr:formate/nitrite transporter family protein [Armatimonadota bacterium]